MHEEEEIICVNEPLCMSVRAYLEEYLRVMYISKFSSWGYMNWSTYDKYGTATISDVWWCWSSKRLPLAFLAHFLQF